MLKGTLMPFRDLDAEGIQDEMDELDGDEGKAIECVAWSSHPEDESVVVTAHKSGKVRICSQRYTSGTSISTLLLFSPQYELVLLW